MRARFALIVAMLASLLLLPGQAARVLPGRAAKAAVPDVSAATAPAARFGWQEIPHSRLMLLVPEGWTIEYDQGTTTLASGSRSRYFSPSERFAGALVQVFVSDAPRAAGARFDLMTLAEDFIALQPVPTQDPTLREGRGKQIVTTRYAVQGMQGQAMTHLAAFVVERQVLTVFLAHTPEDTGATYLPILERMVVSIQWKPLIR
jgi:hypothetical protein